MDTFVIDIMNDPYHNDHPIKDFLNKESPPLLTHKNTIEELCMGMYSSENEELKLFKDAVDEILKKYDLFIFNNNYGNGHIRRFIVAEFTEENIIKRGDNLRTAVSEIMQLVNSQISLSNPKGDIQ